MGSAVGVDTVWNSVAVGIYRAEVGKSGNLYIQCHLVLVSSNQGVIVYRWENGKEKTK